MKMALDLHRAILIILHALYSIYVYTRRLCLKLRDQCGELMNGPRSLKAELEYISRELTCVKKIPSHLVLIFGDESISLKDIVNITLWSQAAGIPHVSFYDFKGNIKKHKPAFDMALAAAKEFKHHVSNANGYKNGLSSKTTPTIRFLDMTEGKSAIVQVTKDLCQQASAGQLSPNEIKLDLLDELILRKSGIPTPDLALYCGDICSSYAFPPWHLQVTEFLPLHSHHNVKAQTFVSVLRQFSLCDQRMGT